MNKEEKKQKKEIFKCLKEWLVTKKGEDKFKLKMERLKLKRLRKRIKEKETEGKWREIEESRDMGDFWMAVGNFRAKRKARKERNISKEDWEKRFRKFLGKGQVEEEQNQNREKKERETNSQVKEGENGLNREIEAGEVRVSLTKMKNKKASGEDGIKVEFLKYLPLGWKIARIYPIYKAGNEELAENYRGVALLDVRYKLLTNIIANRLSVWCERNKVIRESQAGFRGKRGTRDHLFVINSLIGNKLKIKGGKLYAGLIDFKTAFDTVDRKILFKKLQKKGIKGKILKEGRWPLICLREELRWIINGYPTKWGKEVEKSFKEIGDGQTLREMFERRDVIEIRKNLEKGRKTKTDQEIQIEWGKIEKSKVERRVGTGKEIGKNVLELLKGESILGICEYCKQFEKLARSRTEGK
ncbi:hypothetical protein TSAR_013439 [Trichomalopsis sarcophagae]|uniref:Reverse transcriptase domain-containing protein n=1 Tax=Trichomalopsis sarcophagae TaxID=543379 RepID=A0A232EMM3_9HYME|nr:hypothetical protein TSAR_013439 [Trichomalopsis sarcophagae]